ncbi:MAG: hypothetical protein A2Y40_05360 [Candidatus Margulisbacteria bacterium GWF2_35_9]|nr:MAG: hypothetical protein A2Y40_05360 [Candidatus Margulisbacteria bacterium GWF2_35_9]
MKRIFYTCWFLVIVLSVSVLIGGKIKPIGKRFLYQINGKGDLYTFCMVDEFKENFLVKRSANPKNNIASSDILTLGDSFFNSSIESFKAPQELETMINKNVYNFNLYVDDVLLNPLVYFKNGLYKSSDKKVLILETVERYSVNRIKNYSNLYSVSGYSTFERLRMKLFNNADMEYFFKNNVIIGPINKKIKNIRFNLFGEVDNRVTFYSENPKMLFYNESVAFNKSKKKQEDLILYADKMAELAKELENKYNVELVYIIIPNKFSIYYDFLDIMYSYDGFIPKFQNLLSERGVNYVDVYSEYMNYRKHDDSNLLYYMGDTHYTTLGKEMLLKSVIKKLEGMNK